MKTNMAPESTAPILIGFFRDRVRVSDAPLPIAGVGEAVLAGTGVDLRSAPGGRSEWKGLRNRLAELADPAGAFYAYGLVRRTGRGMYARGAVEDIPGDMLGTAADRIADVRFGEAWHPRPRAGGRRDAKEFTPDDRARAFDAQDGVCVFCGDDMVRPYFAVADHIVPVDQGGPTIISNCAAAHPLCNGVKSFRTRSETFDAHRKAGRVVLPGRADRAWRLREDRIGLYVPKKEDDDDVS